MVRKEWVTMLLFVCLIACGVCSAAVEPTKMVLTPQVNSSGPYDDEKFQSVVVPVINGLVDRKLNASERIDVQSAYYTACSMKVSPEFYPVAYNVTKLLFYLVSSSESYEELDKTSGLGAYNKDMRTSLKAQADADSDAAEEAWGGIAVLYPNSTLFR